MKLTRFKIFVAEVENDFAIQSAVVRLSFFRKFDGIWYTATDEIVEDNLLCDTLDNCLPLEESWKAIKSVDAYFPVHELDALVRATFLSSPIKRTRAPIEEIIAKCLERAQAKFDAAHDPLTELLNEKAFNTALKEEIDNIANRQVDERSEIDVPEPKTSLSLLALDIDYFKQVNDTYGHTYGNVVLRCFARRIEQRCRDLETKFAGRARFVCARPSGEEFSILITGAISTEDEEQIAEDIRSTIADNPLPDDDEWASCSDGELPEGVDLPPANERQIRVSIGVATAYPEPGTQSTERIAVNVINQSDIALYRAKAAGRNCAIRFPEILARHGRVLGHHKDTRVVIIDLGRQVRVSEGQEFKVFHSDFSGNVPYIYSDGRTKKTLGRYPKIPRGRIEVFDVQLEIAFCRVLKAYDIELFPPGSILEAIPLGTISHLIGGDLSRGGQAGLQVSTTRDLRSAIDKIIEEQQFPFTRVLNLKNVDTMVNDLGIAFVNRTLAQLYTSIRENVPRSATIGQISESQLAFVVDNNLFADDEHVLRIISDVEDAQENVPNFTAGIFSSTDMASVGQEGDQSAFDPKFGLDYAQFASSSNGSGKTKLVHFSPSVAHDILYRSRLNRLYGTAKKDFEMLNEIGINNAWVENQISLILFQDYDLEGSIEGIRRALSLKNDDLTLLGNYGLLLFVSGDRLESAEKFVRVLELDENYNWSDPYVSAVAMALYRRFTNDPTTVDLSYLESMLARATDVEIPGYLKIDVRDVEEGLGEVRALLRSHLENSAFEE